jgi:hypothetical protein
MPMGTARESPELRPRPKGGGREASPKAFAHFALKLCPAAIYDTRPVGMILVVCIGIIVQHQ